MAPDPAVARARALIGTPFRLHGRDPATGLDCVGLIACAVPTTAAVPTGYRLRGGDVTSLCAVIDAILPRDPGGLRHPAVLLMRPSAVQFHLGIWTGASLIHAHAGLRRVVETPGTPADPIIATWQTGPEIWRH